MKCQYCGKKATVHLTEIVDAQMTELHLCEKCAKEKSMAMEQQFGLGDLLAGLAGFGTTVKQPTKQEVVACDNCGMTYDQFKEGGRLGCSACYSKFRQEIGNLLKKIHGSNRHLGKKPFKIHPEKIDQVEELEDLKERLKKAILIEDFEAAATLRDEIKQAENGK
ncbi:MAG: UvrB/UvrC motif-containing protein [Candidatus Omnitrophica bacterium]|nr:UvrB/UvrC motif-containing protein [Candidatus Omnitrophota bacterium]